MKMFEIVSKATVCMGSFPEKQWTDTRLMAVSAISHHFPHPSFSGERQRFLLGEWR